MKRILSILLILMLLLPLSAKTAVWYTGQSPDGRTASGKIFKDSLSFAASDEYALGTILEVTNTANGKSTILTVEDMLPAGLKNRDIAITTIAIKELGMQDSGKAEVDIKVIRGSLKEEKKEEKTGWYALYAGTFSLDNCWKYYQRFRKNGLRPAVVKTEEGYRLYAKYLSSFELKGADNAVALSGISSAEIVEDSNPLDK